MLKVGLKPLLNRLNTFCQDGLQAAAALARETGCAEVGPEHFLIRLCQSELSDFSRIIKGFRLDREEIVLALEGGISQRLRGGADRPVMSSALIDLLRDSWLAASIELGGSEIRSGAVFLALLSRDSVSGAPPYLECLRPVGLETLKSRFQEMTAGSIESNGPEESIFSPAESAEGGVGTPLERYCVDYVERAGSGGSDPVFGREREIRRIIDILSRRRKNNPIIVGDAGVGKTALVEGLALRIAQGEEDLPSEFRNVSLLGLDIGLLEAGAGIKGEFESRLKSVISAIKESPVPVILFIDEAHTLIGAGGRAGGGDAANLLKPALARGELRTIAATTWSEYKRYFEKDAALSRRFQRVSLSEPSVETTVLILRGLKERYEEDHGVVVREDAIQAAAELSNRYITGRQLPDKAVDLLDTSAARVKNSLTGKPEPLQDAERTIQDLKRQIEGLCRDRRNGLEIDEEGLNLAWRRMERLKAEAKTLRERWIEEKTLVDEILDLRARGNGPEAKTAIQDLLDRLEASRQGRPLVRYEVDPEVVARVVSDWTGVPLGKIKRAEVDSVLNLYENLGRRIRGQDQALAIISKNIGSAVSGLTPANSPLGVFLLAGPSGVGKTQTALAVSDLLFGDESSIVSINMSEFHERHSLSRLIGSPPGYVGYGEGGVLTDAVRRRPYCVILLDEAEKAHPEVMDLFLQVFDKGFLADGEGRTVDFRNTIFFLTSNLASEEIVSICSAGAPHDAEETAQAIRPELVRHFKPALMARMTVVPYHTLDRPAIREIVEIKLERLAARLLANNQMRLSFDDEVVDGIAAMCNGVDTGARGVDHLLSAEILPRISEGVLKRLSRGEGGPSALILSHDHGFRVEFENGS